MFREFSNRKQSKTYQSELMERHINKFGLNFLIQIYGLLKMLEFNFFFFEFIFFSNKKSNKIQLSNFIVIKFDIKLIPFLRNKKRSIKKSYPPSLCK